MTTPISDNNLLAQLAGLGAPARAVRRWTAWRRPNRGTTRPQRRADAKLDALVDRIRSLTAGASAAGIRLGRDRPRSRARPAVPGTRKRAPGFVPQEPRRSAPPD